jgi:Fe-S cluster assembly scaffold protein SufB
MSSSENLGKKARSVQEKKARLGPDIDLSKYSLSAEEYASMDFTSLSNAEQEMLALAGIDVTGTSRSGTFVQMDHSVVCSQVNQEGLEVLSTDVALTKYRWLQDYWWKAVPVDMDKYTSHAELQWTKGYFLRALPGVKSIFPLQACLCLYQDNIAQNVHNVVIVEEGAELHLITGCVSNPHIRSGLHIGVSEYYIKKGGKLTFTMIHNWSEKVAVRPRSAAIVEKNGLFLSNYICLQPVESVQLYPTAYLEGESAVTRFNSILLASPHSLLDVGSRVYLRKPRCRAEIVSRAVTRGGNVWARGHLIGEAPSIKAHMECQGLILGKEGVIHAVPELEGCTKDVEMSHEASVGRIAGEQITYLMARGLSEAEAIATIVRGFLDVKIEGLPPELQRELTRVASASEKYMF